jgi:hypothetical protein
MIDHFSVIISVGGFVFEPFEKSAKIPCAANRKPNILS